MSTTTTINGSASPIRVAHTAEMDDDRPQGTSRRSSRAAGRRSFDPGYKLAILAEYDRCTEPGEKGALLRREGLYSSLLSDWRRQHRQGLLTAQQGRSEGGRGGPSLSEMARLRADNERLRQQLAKAQVVIDVQGEVHALLEELSKSADAEEQ